MHNWTQKLSGALKKHGQNLRHGQKLIARVLLNQKLTI